MSIEVYTTIINYCYIGLLLFLMLTGVVELWKKIRKKPSKYRLLIPYSIIYLFIAMVSSFAASIAYDDPADPNYWRYQNWDLCDFILHDIKMLIIWLLIGILFYRLKQKNICKKTHENILYGIMISFIVVLAAIMILSYMTL